MGFSGNGLSQSDFNKFLDEICAIGTLPKEVAVKRVQNAKPGGCLGVLLYT